MNMSTFDFSKVEVAKSSQYVRPGMWKMSVTDVELVTPENKNPCLNITFSKSDGASFRDRFFITPKALSRLQYLHEAWFGKKLEKAFTSVEQLGEYFKKALTTKSKEMPMIVGGEENAEGRVYARLPFTGFVVTNEDLFEEGEFEKGTARYNEVVKRSEMTTSDALSTDSAVLPSGDSEADATEDSEMPW
jgi:hypothetical protein